MGDLSDKPIYQEVGDYLYKFKKNGRVMYKRLTDEEVTQIMAGAGNGNK